MRISDWSSDVCSSDLKDHHHDARDQKRIANRIFMRREPRYVLRGVPRLAEEFTNELLPKGHAETENGKDKTYTIDNQNICRHPLISHRASINSLLANTGLARNLPRHGQRSEEHTSELQSLMRISYAVF